MFIPSRTSINNNARIVIALFIAATLAQKERRENDASCLIRDMTLNVHPKALC